MKTRRFYTHAIIIATMLTMFGAAGYAQPVDIPDANLRAAISEALNGAPITQASMRRLTTLDARDRQIVRLTGLEYATNLKELSLVYNNISDLTPLTGLRLTELRLWDNKVSDLAPLANLTTLTVLDVGDCRISDISPLANLIQLEWLEIRSNQISDISALSNLTQLIYLDAHNNQIVDVRPLTSLPRLEELKIAANLIIDHSPLDVLPLTHFEYDETCDMPPASARSHGWIIELFRVCFPRGAGWVGARCLISPIYQTWNRWHSTISTGVVCCGVTAFIETETLWNYEGGKRMRHLIAMPILPSIQTW